MSNLKDTDFDDLFRRASDKYPLRTDSSDWDRMAAALEKDPSPDAFDEVDNPDRRRRRRFFWWFLLLPLAGIGYLVVDLSGHGGHKPAGQVTARSGGEPAAANANGTPANNVVVTKPAATKPAATGSAATGAAAKDAAAKDAAAKDAAANDAAEKDAAAKDAAAKDAAENKPIDNNATAPALSEGQAGAGMPHKAPRMVNSTNPKNSGKIIRSAGGTSLELLRHAPPRSGSSRSPEPFPVRPATTAKVRPETTAKVRPETNRTEADRISDDQIATIDPTTNPVAAAFTLRNTNINQQRARIAAPYALKVAVKAKEIKKDSTKPKSKNQSYLYAGIVGAPDLSTVKFQSTKGVGTTFGVIIGYAFGPHWAIETGAYVERKRYYTDGEYFSTKKISISPTVDLLNVDGNCYMWEIPLNVRYTFNPAGKTRWFATAGLSTYLMNREKYTYEAKYYNYPNAWYKSVDWKTPSQYPFSLIGFSAGFEQRLGGVGNLRIEPYVRVPLGGIGTGSLPIMSTGINIGITRRLWK